ncbi:MAG: glycosyltransferase [Balneolaceae bacterium]|nr:MAG: glycosyltransferase [Balneolaceae bacterium]
METIINNSVASLPFFSVVVPFKGNLEQVNNLIIHLERQKYPATHVEVILIDNGSDDPSDYPKSEKINLSFLSEQRYADSPYSARNRGIEAAAGDVVVFTDANSYPDSGWLQEAANMLIHSKCDLLAGAVKFSFGEKVTSAKIADSIISIQMKRSVLERKVAYTANLFVKKEVFSKTGLFEEGARSGGDVRFCKKADSEGYSITYCEKAVVFKEARSYGALFNKKIRTGRGYYYTWITEKRAGEKWYSNFLRVLKPQGFFALKAHDRITLSNIFLVWIIIYTARIAEQISFIREYYRNR